MGWDGISSRLGVLPGGTLRTLRLFTLSMCVCLSHGHYLSSTSLLLILQDDIREGETGEEALQRRIEEGKIGKGKTLRRWKDTEEKVCRCGERLVPSMLMVLMSVFGFIV